MNDRTKKRLEAEKLRMEKKYGHKAAAFGSADYKLNVVPSGVLALDYALGIGGWPRGHLVEIFGAPDIGKSSVLGFNVLKNAQAEGMTCGIVALEPSFDKKWAIKHGVDPEWLIIGRPDSGEEAFQMLHDWVTDDLVDFVLFDSIGSILAQTETEADGKAKQGGQSGLITWGVKRCVMPVWKNNKGVILLNQIRDDMDSRIKGLVESPGGWALKHSCAVRIHLKAGKERFTTKDNGDDVITGRELVATIKRNKLSEGTGRKASFDYYGMEVEGEPFNIDTTDDILNTALRTGVIEKAGAYYRHPAFPKQANGNNQLQGAPAIAEFIDNHPEVIQTLRNEVLAVMFRKASRPQDDDQVAMEAAA